MAVISLSQINDYINELAPSHLAKKWDNVGLLIGNPSTQISNIMLALDITKDVLMDAIENDIQLIITHHPVIFDPIKCINNESIVYQLIKHDIAVISAHTNLDLADGGVNDVLAKTLGLCNLTPLVDEDGLGRIGTLLNPITVTGLADLVKSKLDVPFVRLCDNHGDNLIYTVAVIGGNGSDEIEYALQKKADAYISGEISHQHYVAAINAGITVIDAGHFFTENVIIHTLFQKLIDHFGDSINISISNANNPVYTIY